MPLTYKTHIMLQQAIRYYMTLAAMLAGMHSTQAQYLADAGTTTRVSDPLAEAERATQQGEFQRAIALYTIAIEAGQEQVNAHLQRAFCHMLVSDHEAAIRDLDVVLAARPDHVQAYTSRGSAYAKMGRTDRAIADLDQAIALDPGNQEAYNNRGWAHRKAGDPKAACRDWQTSRKLGNPEAALILKNTPCK
jgi:tetratricopeptide (TPR) repeat protein